MDILNKLTAPDGMIILGFLLLNLLIGIYFSKDITNIKNYALGNRSFSTAAISYTIAATWMSSGTFNFTVYEISKEGLYFFVPFIGEVIALLIIAYLYAPRMQEFLGKLSIAEAMGDMYGDAVKIITAIAGIISALARVIAQFTILNILLTYFFDVPGFYALILCYIIIITYSLFGGIKAVTFTDTIQFFTFGLVLPMTAFFMWQSYDNAAADVLYTLKTSPLFDYRSFIQFNNPRFSSTIFLFLFFAIPDMDPGYFQRLCMTCNIKQAMKAFAIAALLLFVCECIFIAFIGLLLFGDTTLTDSNAMITILDNNYLGVGFKGCFVIGIMSMAMSTADSYINTISILSYDISKAIGIKMSEKGTLFYVRMIACLSGILAITLSLLPSYSLLTLVEYSAGFYIVIVTAPFTLAIFGFRSSGKSVLLGMFVGFCTTLTYKLGHIGIGNTVVISMLANILTSIGSHYLLRQPGGWVEVKDDGTFLEIKKARRKRIQNFFSAIQNFDIISYLKNTAKKQEATYVYFGFCCIISIVFNLYSLPKIVIDQNEMLISIISYITLFLSTILISYHAWTDTFKNQLFISFIEHLTVFILMFVSVFFTLINHFEQLQIMIFSVSLIMTAVLLRWHIALLFIFSAILIPTLLYKPHTDLINFGIESNIAVSLAYISVMTCFICIIFLKPKTDNLDILEEKSTNLWQKVNDMDKEVRNSNNIKTEFLNNISHEIRTPMTGITSLGQALWDNYDSIPESKRRECIHTIAKNSERLISLMNNILDFSTLTSLKMELHLKKINLSEVVEDSIKRCKKLYLEDKELRFNLDIEKKVYTKCDVHYITHAIDNLIINAIAYSKPGTIIDITFKKKDGLSCFAIRDEGFGIPQDELSNIFRAFTTSSKTSTPAGGRGLGLALCYTTIVAHKGRIWAESDSVSWAEFKFEI